MIEDIQTTFNSVTPDKASKFSISRPSGIKLPEGAGSDNHHQQGIQKTVRGEFVVSGSAEDTGYIYFTDSNCNISNVICPDYDNLNHIGGIQVVNDILVAGYERFEDGKNGKSKVLFYDIRNISWPQQMTYLTISRDTEGSTAGAVAMSRFNRGWLLLVANWDSVRLDFYYCAESDLLNPKASFPSTPDGSWSKKVNGLGSGSIDQNWEAYQNINLFMQGTLPSSSLWFIGMHTNEDDANADWGDLYELDYQGSQSIVTKRGKMHFIRNGEGPRFKYGSGYYYDETAGRFEVYACEAHLSSNSTTSRCNKWT
jgi:hypothetical protein